MIKPPPAFGRLSGRPALHTVSAQISLRPLRVGFFVDPADRATLSRVMRLATCLWGGMMCPLIPVMRHLPKPWRGEPFRRPTPAKLTRGMLNFFEPDAFVETTDGQFEAAGLTGPQTWHGQTRFRTLDQLVSTEPGRAPFLDIGVSMHLIYEQLFRDEFQFKKRRESQVYDFDGGDRNANLFFEAAYGAFPKAAGIDYIRTFYQEALAATTVAPSHAKWVSLVRGEASYPLHYTTRSMEQRFEGGWGETIFIFDPLSATDVIDFWNLRLFTRDVMPVNVHWLAQSRDLIVETIRRNYRPLPSNANGVMISTTVAIARSLDPARIAEALDLASAALPKGSAAFQSWYEPIWMTPEEDRMFRPVAAPLVAKHQEVQLVPDGQDHSLRLPLLSPAGVSTLYGHGPGWVNVVRTRFYGNDSYAQALPSAAIAEHERYPPRTHVPQIPTREGAVSFHDFPHDGSSLRLMTRHEAVTGWLHAVGIEAQVSDAGRVADELIGSIGGITRAVILAHPEAITQFDKMARSRLIRHGGDSEEYPDRTATADQLAAMIRKIQKRLYGRHITIQSYVEAGVLRLGIAVRCTHCVKENWYSLDDIAATNRCERCLKLFEFPQGRMPSKDTWKYRVVGPFAAPHYAQGAYSVALTLRFLAVALGSMAEFTYTTSLNLKLSEEQLETDFFVWHNKHAFTRNARDPALLVGECKSFGTELFKSQDIARLRRLGEALPGAYLVAATLKPTLSAREIAGLRALCRWGWRRAGVDRPPTRLIVLTGTELFAIGSLMPAWKAEGGALAAVAERFPYIMTFDELARATQMAYLGFTADELHGLVVRRARKGPPPHARGILVRA